MARCKKGGKGLENLINQLKSCEPLSYLMLPVLHELEEAYTSKTEVNASWNNVQINEIAELIEELDDIILRIESPLYEIYSEVMKKSTYLINLDLWIKVMELLIFECQELWGM